MIENFGEAPAGERMYEYEDQSWMWSKFPHFGMNIASHTSPHILRILYQGKNTLVQPVKTPFLQTMIFNSDQFQIQKYYNNKC